VKALPDTATGMGVAAEAIWRGIQVMLGVIVGLLAVVVDLLVFIATRLI
jgi:hypothetical protein